MDLQSVSREKSSDLLLKYVYLIKILIINKTL